MANAGNDGYLIPEQVWDRAGQFGFAFGATTGSAAPLNWCAAQYVRLAVSIDAGRPVETPTPVTARYAGR
jgi:glucoamylase